MNPSTANNPESEIVVAAIERVLRQLMKLLIGRMAFPKFLALVRKIFVEESEAFLRREKDQKSISLTDLGLVTGIDTRTINKIRNSDDYEKPISESRSFFVDLTPEAVVVDKWQLDPEFTNENGDPVKLKIWGEHRSFESLVQSTIKSRGITVKSILKRLIDTNSISVSEDDNFVTLHPELWISYQSTGAEGAIRAGLLAVSQHFNTVLNNIDSITEDLEPKFERIFWCNRIDPSKLDDFRKDLEQFLENASGQAVKVIEPYDKDFELKESISGGVGLYYFDSKGF